MNVRGVGRPLLIGVGTAAVVVGLVAAGYLTPTHPQYVLIAAGVVFVFGVTLIEPAVLPLAAMPLLFALQRVGAGSTSLTLSDVGLFTALLPAAVLFPRPVSPPMRQALWLVTIYQAALLPTLVVNPFRANTIEFFHAGMLIGGALLIGWMIGRRGFGPLGLKLLLAAGAVLAVAALVEAVRRFSHGDLSPITLHTPSPMGKNALGDVLAILAVIAYVNPSWTRIGHRLSRILLTLLVAGVGVSQSRQAIIGLGVAAFVIAFRRDTERRRSQLIVLLLVPLAAAVALTVRFQALSGNRFNSLNVRLDWFGQTIQVWSTNWLFGAGMRWWYTPRFPFSFQPPNAEMEVASIAGAVGLIAFLVMMIGILRLLWRLDHSFGTLAFCCVLSRLTQAQFDIFWVAVQTSLPFVIAGICLGAEARAHPPADPHLPAARRVLQRAGATTA